MVLVIAFIGARKDPRPEKSQCQSPNNHAPRHKRTPTSLRWIKSLLYYKNGQEEYRNYLYQGAVISVLAVGYSMLGKKILKIAPPSIQRFDLEDTGKLVAIVAASEMTREYLIKQKILPDHVDI